MNVLVQRRELLLAEEPISAPVEQREGELRLRRGQLDPVSLEDLLELWEGNVPVVILVEVLERLVDEFRVLSAHGLVWVEL